LPQTLEAWQFVARWRIRATQPINGIGSNVRMRELCRVLDTELEVMTYLTYAATQRRSKRAKCGGYLEIAQLALNRRQKIVLEHC
jgi:hypothetical protein